MNARSGVFATLAAAFAVMLAAPCPAPIFGSFPGIDYLIEDADAIIVAEVGGVCVPDDIRERQKTEWVMLNRPSVSGMHDQYECRIVRTLKGDLATGDALLALRWLGAPPKAAGGADDLLPATPPPYVDKSRGLQLIFLEGDPPLMSRNCVGAIVSVPKSIAMENLDGLSAEEAVHRIVGNTPPRDPRNDLAPERRAEHKRMRLRHEPKYERDRCISVQVVENQAPGQPKSFKKPTAAAYHYDPTNGIAEKGDVIRPKQE